MTTVAVLVAAEDDMVRDVIRGLMLEEDPAAVDVEPEVRRRAARDLVHRLLARSLAAHEQELRDRLSRLDAVGHSDAVLTLQRELQGLSARRRAMRESTDA